MLAEGSNRDFSVIRLRRGGIGVCAAWEVREKVCTNCNHRRWGLVGAVRRGLTPKGERRNDSVLGRDNGAMRKALHAVLNKTAPKRSWLVEQGLQSVDELGRKLGVWVLSQPWG